MVVQELIRQPIELVFLELDALLALEEVAELVQVHATNVVVIDAVRECTILLEDVVYFYLA